MLDAFKRLIARKPSEPEWSDVADWAERRRLGFKRVRDEGGGFVLDGSINGKPWRLEWGPPQRKYIDGHELRIRMELGLSPNLQMLVLSQPLYETLERTAFESITESTQTVIDGNTPEEVRWIVMFPKANVKGSKALRSRFHFTGAAAVDAERWLEGPLGEAFERADAGFLSGQPPFVLMVLRGRVYLRMQLDAPDVASLSGALALFETAVPEALRVASLITDAPAPPEDEWASSSGSDATAWQTELGPEDRKLP
jgi:hypothetical protein